MSRDIKFRGKCSGQSKYAGEWVEGGLVVPQEITNNEVLIIRAIADGCTTTYHVDADTIGQYTGLNDKNGKEIYEGDILMCIGERNDNKGRKYYRKVLFDNGAFGMTVPEYKFISALCNHVVNGKLNWEVIGNIYDNSEFLEEKL